MSAQEEPEPSDTHQRSNDYAVEYDEWEDIKALPLIDLSHNIQGFQFTAEASYASYESRVTSSANLEEVLSYFDGIDLSEQLSRIQPIQTQIGFYGILSQMFCLSPPKLNTSLISERNRVFAIALRPFDSHDSMQNRFLVTIYQKLTGSALIECRRFGNHWEDVGFQGTDPATDLRGVGLLGLLQILFLILSSETNQLCKEIYLLSVDRHQHFPFAVMSTNVTQIALQVLREGLLNKECNEAKCVLKVFNWFYSGVFYQLYKVWKENGKTIVDSGYVLRDIRKSVRKDVKRVIVEMLSFKNELQTKTNIKDTEDDITFSNLGDMFVELEEYKP